ncbi:MAG: ABC transporter ATP-binding protein [Desulfosudaceae bacterium]
MNDKQPLIELSGVSFSYSEDDRLILDNLDFSLYRGDRVGLLAPNGSGKTTFFHVIMGLLKPRAGMIRFRGRHLRTEKDYTRLRRRVGLLFQDADDQLFCPTVLEDVAFGPLNMGKSRQEAIAIARRTLAFLGLTGYEDRITFKMSGGEKRLVSLAAVLAMDPEVLLLDEPLSGLDIQTRRVISRVLSTINLSYIIISHEIDFLAATTQTMMTLEKGRVVPETRIHYHRHDHAHALGDRPHRHD